MLTPVELNSQDQESKAQPTELTWHVLVKGSLD